MRRPLLICAICLTPDSLHSRRRRSKRNKVSRATAALIPPPDRTRPATASPETATPRSNGAEQPGATLVVLPSRVDHVACTGENDVENACAGAQAPHSTGLQTSNVRRNDNQPGESFVGRFRSCR